MGGHVRLYEDRAHIRVQAGGEQQPGDLQCPLPDQVRLVLDGQRVQVDHAEQRVGRMLTGHPQLDRAEEMAERESPARSRAAEDPGWGRRRRSPRTVRCSGRVFCLR
jgi:hypothetical protein